MRWQAYLTNQRVTSITSEYIKAYPQYYQQYFKDVNNPTDIEIERYFMDYFFNMRDEWEIPVNGTFRIDKTNDQIDTVLPQGVTVHPSIGANITRLDENKIQITFGVDEYCLILESAAPIRSSRVEKSQEPLVKLPLRSNPINKI